MHAYVKLFVVCACFCDCVVVQWFRFQTVGTLLLRGIFYGYTNMPIGRPELHRAKCSAVSLQTQPPRYGEPFLLMPPTTSSAANFARVMELGPDNNKTQFIVSWHHQWASIKPLLGIATSNRSLVLSTIKPMPEECTTKCPGEFGHVKMERQFGFAHWKFPWRCYVILSLNMCVRRIRA